MTYRTKNQNSQLWALLGKLNLPEDALREKVYKLTNGRTSSTKETTAMECMELLRDLRSLESKIITKAPSQKPSRFQFEDSPENEMRRKIFSRCHEMNWRTPAGKVDKVKLESWLEKYGYLHKPLNKYTFEELPKLVFQFDQLLKDYYAKR